MSIKVDVWGGDLHQNHVDSAEFTHQEDAFLFISEMIEAGCLCNVLHRDFEVPEERHGEAREALAKHI